MRSAKSNEDELEIYRVKYRTIFGGRRIGGGSTTRTVLVDEVGDGDDIFYFSETGSPLTNSEGIRVLEWMRENKVRYHNPETGETIQEGD